MTLKPVAHRSSTPSAITLVLIFAAIIVGGCQPQSPAPADLEYDGTPYVKADTPVEAGRYLAIVGGCNDCHTDGYLQTEGQIPEEEWFTGSAMGWRGPWGTTYASNLRLTVQDMSEDDWVMTIHERTALPPMPWMNVNQMSDQDARAIYQYLVSLGPKGEPMPGAIPPGEEPVTPYLLLEPQNLGSPPPAE